jgi:hypothetical protein
VDQTSAKLGRPPRIHLTYYSWADDWTGITTKADLAAGRIPLVNWEPAKTNFAKIADGSLDATILAYGRLALLIAACALIFGLSTPIQPI